MTLKKLYEQIDVVEECLKLAKERSRTQRQAELQRQLRALRLEQMRLEQKAAKASRRAA